MGWLSAAVCCVRARSTLLVGLVTVFTACNVFMSTFPAAPTSTEQAHYLLRRHAVVPERDWRIPAVGFITCLSDRTSVLHALALVQSLSNNNKDPFSSKYVMVEIYHDFATSPPLSYYMEKQLEQFGNAWVVELEPLPTSLSEASSCRERALQRTRLDRAVWIEHPSVVFLQPPEMVLASSRRELGSVSGIGTAELTEGGGDFARIFGSGTGAAWAYPKNVSLNWITHRLALLQQKPGNNNSMLQSSPILDRIQSHWRTNLLPNRRLLTLDDRPIHWAAFDGGVHAQPLSGPLNSLLAAQAAAAAGAELINIDLAYTADQHNIAIHSDEAFSPFDQHALETRVTKLTLAQARDLVHPCPSDTLKRYILDGNSYRTYPCQSNEKVVTAAEILEQLPDATNIIFDLKSPTRQLEQAVDLAAFSAANTCHGCIIAVRFFSTFDTADLVGSVISDEAWQWLATDDRLQTLPYYVNTPTALACRHLAAWIQSNADFQNKLLEGCFVELHHEPLTAQWDAFVERYAIDTTTTASVNMTDTQQQKSLQILCDTPRELSSAQTWGASYMECVEEGFDMVHHPFRISSSAAAAPTRQPVSADMGTIVPLLTNIPDFHKLARNKIQEAIDEFWTRTKRRKLVELSQWGVASPYDWSNRRSWWLRNSTVVPADNMTNVPHRTDALFRCISKVLTIMLYYRLQELGQINLDDSVPPHHNVTWRNIFTNTAQGKGFAYSNAPWYDVVEAGVVNATGMGFIEAFIYHIGEKMGLVGAFHPDATAKNQVPFPARGYLGPIDDLLLIGCTLANGGVSPKTRKQILSLESIRDLLANRTRVSDPVLGDSFRRDPNAAGMWRFQAPWDRSNPYGNVTGYGTGMWHFEGLRPGMKAWMCMGQAMIYFDSTGLVVATHMPTKGNLPFESTVPFARAIREIGGYITMNVLSS